MDGDDLMGYNWQNWHQEISYNWSGWFAYRPRWENPWSDTPGTRHLNTERVNQSVPVSWPEEYQGIKLGVGVGQKVWQGSVANAGGPMQRVDRMRQRLFAVDNKWGGDLWRDGKFVAKLKAGEKWDVLVPEPARLAQDGWAVEGYPNMWNRGDRHWYGIEDNGTAHEAIWIIAREHGGQNTMLDYCRFAPDGSVLTGIVGRNGKTGVVKGQVQWTSLAWNRGDRPHRLGIVFHDMAMVGMNGAPSDGTRADWTMPAYGQLFRLGAEVYNRLSANADDEQQSFLDSAHHFGVMPFDRGGNNWGAGVGMVAGSQHVGSTIGALEIKITDLELVTGV